MKSIPGCVFIHGDIMDKMVRAEIVNQLDMRPVDIVSISLY